MRTGLILLGMAVAIVAWGVMYSGLTILNPALGPCEGMGLSIAQALTPGKVNCGSNIVGAPGNPGGTGKCPPGTTDICPPGSPGFVQDCCRPTGQGGGQFA